MLISTAVHSSYIYRCTQKKSGCDTVNPWEIYFYLLVYLCFFVVYIHNVFFKKFVFAFTIPFTFSEIMKALLLVEYLLTPGFLNSH